ncbi:hypothetical protein ACWIB8_08290 [Corynebacterium flavescens]
MFDGRAANEMHSVVSLLSSGMIVTAPLILGQPMNSARWGDRAQFAVEGVDCGELVAGEVEPEHLQVLRVASRGDGLGDDDAPLLQVPA